MSKKLSFPAIALTYFSILYPIQSMEDLQNFCNVSHPCYYDGGWRQFDISNNISYPLNFSGNSISNETGFTLADNLGISALALSVGAPILLSLGHRLVDNILYWCSKNIHEGIPSDRKNNEKIQERLKEINLLLDGDPGHGLPALPGSVLHFVTNIEQAQTTALDTNSGGSIANVLQTVEQTVNNIDQIQTTALDVNSPGSIANALQTVGQTVTHIDQVQTTALDVNSPGSIANTLQSVGQTAAHIDQVQNTALNTNSGGSIANVLQSVQQTVGNINQAQTTALDVNSPGSIANVLQTVEQTVNK
jgi:hypothetical protein